MKNIITNERITYLNGLSEALFKLKEFINISEDTCMYEIFMGSLTCDDVLDDTGEEIINRVINEIFKGPYYSRENVVGITRADFSGMHSVSSDKISEMASSIFIEHSGISEFLFKNMFSFRYTRSTLYSDEFLESENPIYSKHFNEIYSAIKYMIDAVASYDINAEFFNNRYGEEETKRLGDQIKMSFCRAIGNCAGSLLNSVFSLDDATLILEKLRTNMFSQIHNIKRFITKNNYENGRAILAKRLRETDNKDDIIDILKFLPAEKDLVANIFLNTTGVVNEPEIAEILKTLEYKSEITANFHRLVQDTTISDEQCISAAYLMFDVFYDMRRRGGVFSKHKFLNNFIEMSIGSYRDRIHQEDTMKTYIDRVAIPILKDNISLFDNVVINKLFSKRETWQYSPADFILTIVLKIVFESTDVVFVKNILEKFLFNRVPILECSPIGTVIKDTNRFSIPGKNINDASAAAIFFNELSLKFPEEDDYFFGKFILTALVNLMDSHSFSRFEDAITYLLAARGMTEAELLEKFRGLGGFFKRIIPQNEMTSVAMLAIASYGHIVREFSRTRNCPIIFSDIILNTPEFNQEKYNQFINTMKTIIPIGGVSPKSLNMGSILKYIRAIPVEFFESFNLLNSDDVNEIYVYRKVSYYNRHEDTISLFNSLRRPLFNVADRNRACYAAILHALYTLKSLVPDNVAENIIRNIFDIYTDEKYSAFKSRIPTYIFEEDDHQIVYRDFHCFRYNIGDFEQLFNKAYPEITESFRYDSPDMLNALFNTLKTILTPYSLSPEVFTNIDDARDTTQFLLM